ncbi:MAG TPA: isoaspartyl peptidase/L-asparaginase [Phenylobacterium sp.]|uniref:isoaspartyl peptidase/L-asparaginase family protein n=1 Tax=Phenylobacterium sp. TaxID=1871053 RepID=UPI002B459B59|nr:isoaspartyl peptidase/L-asparaginase [Phenylobacterium sp.]HKR88178.1 isoaspartyl peptidase/L-asparaginase [Phenylobacterium sp.]
MGGGWALAAHGGAGVIERGLLRPDQEAAYRRAMAHAAEAGAAVLRAGGRALAACEEGVRAMEDDPLFNAGRGSAFTADGEVEMDASIMDGRDLAAGAVAGVISIKNPVSLARAVMERSPHVFLVGHGAEAFARSEGLETAPPAYFFTLRRWSALEHALDERGLPPPPRPAGVVDDLAAALAHDEGKRGTVGVVARDVYGDVAAATSTGGTTGKRWGRVGDSAIIGAGAYASNRGCAVSATGAGEYFIRLAVAKEICALVEHRGLALQAAADAVVQEQLTALGGDGGVIAVSPDGAVAWSFNTAGMYRARIGAAEPLTVGLYKDDP